MKHRLLRTLSPVAYALTVAVASMACHGGSAPSSMGTDHPPDQSAGTSTYESGTSSSSPEYGDDAPRPSSHDEDWMQRHGGMALSEGDDCAVCHTEQDCIECHVESFEQPYAVHPPNYEVVHATDARQGVQDCTTCHRLDTFCATCHMEAGVSPRIEDQPPTSVEFHPPDWLDASAPVNHATQARRDINDCASCHTEQDCIACHRGINPHPPEFQFDCGSILQTDPSSCVQCHNEDVEILQQMCM